MRFLVQVRQVLESASPALSENTCVVCFCVPGLGQKYHLESCGHLHCVGCIKGQIEVAPLPLVCSKEVRNGGGRMKI